eukprot:TRINITY_DN7308_c0_g1_i2.p1 TRINITY_DN7308_c0_g1~~TRINITY_DN7308_c0_g1_i2.p1  ORF type:complete len:531 (+),score=67.40 TRINITY_DN7308_c0_g1_i2:437-2029(+)
MWRKVYKVPDGPSVKENEHAAQDACTGRQVEAVDASDEDISNVKAEDYSPAARNQTQDEEVPAAPKAAPSPLTLAWTRFKERIHKAASESGEEAANFFYGFLRWELAFPFLGTSLTKLGFPVIGFKCQPIRECVNNFVSMAKSFLKFIWVIVKEFVKFAAELVRYAASWRSIDLTKSSPSKTTDAKGEGKSDLDVEVKLPNNFDASVEHVDVGEVVIDADRLTKSSCIKNLRLKGSISFSLTGPSLMFHFGTTPLPLKNWVNSELATCGKSMARSFSMLFNPFKHTTTNKLTELYFAPQQCNPHTVGMCMMLEKTRQCKIKLNYGFLEANHTGAHAPMKEFCRVFEGVTISLAKTQKDHQVHCSAALGPHFDQAKAQVFDLGIGCHHVRKIMKASQCLPESLEESFLHCRKLFGCSHQRSPARTLLKWEDYVSRVMDTVSHFVDLRPGSQKVKTSSQVSERIENVARQGADFQAQVDAVFASGTAANDLDPKAIFLHPLWSDKCFQHSIQRAKKRANICSCVEQTVLQVE